ncbi:glycogen debranching protein GlgX [Amnibacterium setariae]|uniref:glycogen debranching protein GlgX n=1 Tax=Amnibacterium setariae TaxID=2306585 RepID=UPI001F3C1FF5|nr:glycogen debranching protein GlgX [Amnibacterium setariae]
MQAAETAVIDRYRDLGVRQGPDGGVLRVASATATGMELCLLSERDPSWVERRVRMQRGDDGIWTGGSALLTPGRRYAIRAAGPAGPRDAFDRSRQLLDPYARGIVRIDQDSWRSVVVDDRFDWGDVRKPRTPLAESVVYEAHLKGLTKQLRSVPRALRGTYAGLAHESTIAYLKDLGITAVELLPVHQSASEQRLQKQGLVNYWGYNTVGYFAPHAQYASLAAQSAGPQQVLDEFKGMVKHLHAAGIEVWLDVVYNHTAEEGPAGPVQSFRGLDNSTYYRQDEGRYIDTTGCGNSLDCSHEQTRRLVHDSVRYWAEEMQIDGFRFDLAVTLGRDEHVTFTPHAPLLQDLLADPALADVKLIAEPWDVGLGGWQTGGFPKGWSEWNDRYRDTVRDFWLTDTVVTRNGGLARTGIGALANELSGSSWHFSADRGPLASVNFVTAHDGFTLADLTAYNAKHNLGNGESNRDGTDNNRSFNFGIEGATRVERVLADRRRAMRNLLGTLLLSAGVPMLLAGDELGRTQRGNNNAYCQDAPVNWVAWNLADWQTELHDVVRRLIRIRREHPALRPAEHADATSANRMSWFNADGLTMDEAAWNTPENRTLQYLAQTEGDATLLVVHGDETTMRAALPEVEGVEDYELLWTSADDTAFGLHSAPGEHIAISGPTLLLYAAR